MSIKITELLGLLDAPKDLVDGLEKGEKTVDDFKTYFQTTFIAKSMALEDSEIKNALIGKALGSVTTKAKTAFGFENKDIEGKKIEDVIAMGVEKFQAEISDLKKLQSEGGDKAVTALQAKLSKAEKDALDYKTLADTNASLYDDEKKNSAGKIKQFMLGNILSSAKAKITFKDGISEIEKVGFETLLQKNYKIDLSETGEAEIFNTKGEKIKNETGNKFLNLDEVLMIEAKKNNLLKQNNAGSAARNHFATPNQYEGGNNGVPAQRTANGKIIPERRIHPAALKNEA